MCSITNFNQVYRFHYSIHKGNSVNTQIFIDSRDILDIIMGVKAFTRTGRFNEKKFKEGNDTLIHSLIFNKKLGHFKILLPHEDEVLFNIEQLSKSRLSDVTEEERNELIFHFKKIFGIEVDEFIKKKDKEVLAHFKNKANLLYSLRYLFNMDSWKSRINYLIKSGIYNTDEIEYSYDRLLKSELYLKIFKDGFSKERPLLLNTNIVDALVLCILHEKVKDYVSDKNLSVPIFYDSSGIFTKIIKRLNLQEYFEITTNENIRISVIQDSNYFIIQTLFLEEVKNPLITKDNQTVFIAYKNLLDEIQFTVDKNYNLNENHVRNIKEFINMKLIRILWVNQEEEALDLFTKIRNRLNGKEIREEIDDEIDSIVKEIKDRVKTYSLFRSIISTLIKAHKSLSRRYTLNIIKHNENNELDIFRDYGLTRFSICNDVSEELAETIKALFIDENTVHPNEQLSKIAGYLAAGYLQNDKITQKKLTIGISLLWILGKFELITEILSKLENKYEYYSLGFFHAAALIKIHKKGEVQNRVLNILKYINSLNEKFKYENNYKTAIGASYIYYHMWEHNSLSKNFLHDEEIDNQKIDDTINQHLEKAIELAFCAITKLRTDNWYAEGEEYRKRKYLYILNNYIYYVTMGLEISRFNKLNEFVRNLENAKLTYPEHWQYRFDDTLSLYYLRKAYNYSLACSNNNNSQLIESAKSFIQSAIKHNEYAKNKVLITEDEHIIDLTKKRIDDIYAKIYSL